MAPVVKPTGGSTKPRPCVLIVDDEPQMRELARDVVGGALDCRLLFAKDFREAERLLQSETIELLLTDVHLPDGDGMDLLPKLKSAHPQAAAVVMTGDKSISRPINALRAGVFDFLPKPFDAEFLVESVRAALARQSSEAREVRRVRRLKAAVKRLNTSRRTVSKKVDLLCNDLVSAYGELSRQFDDVRVQEGFRKLVDSARDLEQLLCHAMDWLLRQIGYANVAIWLASEEHEFELGAYMKYTIPGEPALTDAMRDGLLPLTLREGLVRLSPEEIAEKLTATEVARLKGQNVLSANCTYLGEPLAAFILFRDAKSPFTDDDAAMVKAISPIFSVALAATVRKTQESGEFEENDTFTGEESEDVESDERREKKKKQRDTRSEADWWKRGEPPPF